ncbi:hypothetical protein ACPCHT_32190 [Nucisporomicrobium flavum]|uniref:hypothetical protein n=1 Tax=Nucisporomicrobium flavum TaxID=2785915 RepID=UPI003C2FE140
MPHRRLVALLVSGLNVLAGCSAEPPAADVRPSGDVATAAPAPASSAPAADNTAALRRAVQAYSDAYLTGEAAVAYALLSQRCRRRMNSEEFSGLAAAAERTYGSALPIRSFDAEVAGNLARVTYTYDLKAINQDAEPWVKENGMWKEDDC